MKKRVVVILIVTSMALSVVGCGKSDSSSGTVKVNSDTLVDVGD